jgi:magnesium-transporting ATPase (P-type)
MKNSKGETPKDIFKKEHKDLQEKGEKWMKETANNCMLVATLIATVVFAATFTVPGGNNQEAGKLDTGKPHLLKSNWFTLFFISNTIALVFSSTSILIFLSILTSRYREDDFLKSIPLRLLSGLAALFISIAGMVSAFSATCFLVYYSKSAWAPTVIIALATIPIILFVQAHFQLFGLIHFTQHTGLDFFFGHIYVVNVDFSSEDADWVIDP